MFKSLYKKLLILFSLSLSSLGSIDAMQFLYQSLGTAIYLPLATTKALALAWTIGYTNKLIDDTLYDTTRELEPPSDNENKPLNAEPDEKRFSSTLKNMLEKLEPIIGHVEPREILEFARAYAGPVLPIARLLAVCFGTQYVLAYITRLFLSVKAGAATASFYSTVGTHAQATVTSLLNFGLKYALPSSSHLVNFLSGCTGIACIMGAGYLLYVAYKEFFKANGTITDRKNGFKYGIASSIASLVANYWISTNVNPKMTSGALPLALYGLISSDLSIANCIT